MVIIVKAIKWFHCDQNILIIYNKWYWVIYYSNKDVGVISFMINKRQIPPVENKSNFFIIY